MRATVELDPYQRAAVGHDSGAAIVLSAPGSGKTAVVAARVARLLREGLKSDQALCLTFSVTAAREMRERIAQLANRPARNLEATISTFHSLAFRIVRQERGTLDWTPSFDCVADRYKARKILRPLLNGLKLNEAQRYIGRMRRAFLSPEEAMAKAATLDEMRLAQVYQVYDAELRKAGKVDFDGMIYWAVRILESSPEVLRRWQAKFRHVIIDEAHDTSPDQQRLAELLAAPEGNLYVVGDAGQAIYCFRGASPRMLTESRNGRRSYYLPKNYRSGLAIVEAFRPLAETEGLAGELAREMEAVTEASGEVKLKGFESSFDEADEAGVTILDAILGGAPPCAFAILARTNAQLMVFSELLASNKIPYHWRGRSFWRLPEVTDALAFVELVFDAKGSSAGKWLTEAVTSPAEAARYLGKDFAAAIIASAAKREVSLLMVKRPEGDWKPWILDRWAELRELLMNLSLQSLSTPPGVMVRLVVESVGLSLTDEEEDEADSNRNDNLDALVQSAAGFDRLSDFVRHAELMLDAGNDPSGVALSTIHSAKGLEWDCVFVVGVAEGLLPHRLSTDEEEERRLLYVGMSRAREFLSVSWHGEPSRFIERIGFRTPKVSDSANGGIGEGKQAEPNTTSPGAGGANRLQESKRP